MFTEKENKTMRIFQGNLYPPDWRGRPKSMAANEIQIWHRFLDQHGKSFTGFYYDVEVTIRNNARHTDHQTFDNIENRLISKRIDAVGVTEKKIWIIELKIIAGLSSIGQLLGYYHLYKAQEVTTLPISLNVVCERIDDDTKFVMSKFGINWFLL